MQYEQMHKMEGTHRCSVCHAPLVTIWAGTEHRLECGAHLGHQGYERIKSLTEAWRAGEEVGPAADKLEKKYGGKPMNSQALTKLGPQEMTKRVEMGKWPGQLTVADKELLVKVALAYGLDPLMGELVPYQGRIYVCITGRRRKAQETGELDGIQSRPGTEEERKARNLIVGDYLGYCQVWRKGASHPFEGYRVVSGEAVERARRAAEGHNRDPYFLPLVNDPQGMSEKRAEGLALSRAFYIPLPSAEDIGTEEVQVPTVRVVDVKIGEIAADGEKGEPLPFESPPSVPTPSAPSPAEPKTEKAPAQLPLNGQPPHDFQWWCKEILKIPGMTTHKAMGKLEIEKADQWKGTWDGALARVKGATQ